VSRYHAELRLREGHYCLRDLRSTNGTFLNGRPSVEEPLKPGDLISLGGLELLFQAEPAGGAGRGS
jgi:pSer/pThr/pTyr-binding forkhead associated (FHA) protein